MFAVFFLVRAFEMELFYDPLVLYFQNDYLYKSIPEINNWKLVVDLLFRYVINSMATIGIIYLIFQDKKYVKFSGFILMMAFIIMS